MRLPSNLATKSKNCRSTLSKAIGDIKHSHIILTSRNKNFVKLNPLKRNFKLINDYFNDSK